MAKVVYIHNRKAVPQERKPDPKIVSRIRKRHERLRQLDRLFQGVGYER